MALRARALGVTLERRHLVGVVVRHRHGAADGAAGDPPRERTATAVPEAEARLRDLAEAVGQALREAG